MLQLIPGGFLKAVVDDTTPVLGGNLDGDGHNIFNIGTGTLGYLVVKDAGGIDLWGGTGVSKAKLIYRDWGTGAFSFEPAGANIIYKSSGVGTTATALKVCAAAAGGDAAFILTDNQTDPSSVALSSFIIASNTTRGDLQFAVKDRVGNQLVFTNAENITHNHDHELKINPTIYIHSDTSPNTDNTQWMSFAHDKTNGVFGLGTGNYIFLDGKFGIGVSDPHSKVEVAGAISSGTMTITASANDTDVSGVNTLYVNTAGVGNDIVIGGLVGGVDGQQLSIVVIDNTNSTTLLHLEEGSPFICLHKGEDETLSPPFWGGWAFVCKGVVWYETSHAKHVP